MGQRDLDGLAVNIDLMVVSMTQSIVLGILVTVAVEPVFAMRLEYWPYIVASFATILSFRPDVFIAGHWHVLPGLLLAAASLGYAYMGLPVLARRSRLILRKNAQSPAR